MREHARTLGSSLGSMSRALQVSLPGTSAAHRSPAHGCYISNSFWHLYHVLLTPSCSLLQLVPFHKFKPEAPLAPNENVPSDHCPLVMAFKFVTSEFVREGSCDRCKCLITQLNSLFSERTAAARGLSGRSVASGVTNQLRCCCHRHVQLVRRNPLGRRGFASAIRCCSAITKYFYFLRIAH